MILERMRNIGIAAHIDAGKTTATEAILYRTGRIHRPGSVDSGTTTTDWMDQEMERGITITSAATACDWRDHLINIIDTPGHVDFTVEVERSLRVLDGCVAIFCAASGVQPQSETVWRQADRYSIPRIAYINKMDRMGANYHDVLHQMRAKLGADVVALQLPIGSHSEFIGMVDLIDREAYVYGTEPHSLHSVEAVPADMVDLVEMFRDHLVAAVAEHDEELEMKYLEGEEPTREELMRVLRAGTLHKSLVPVLCGSSLRGLGTVPLMEAIVDYLPSPLDVADVVGTLPDREDEEVTRGPDREEPFCALLFKVMTDPFTGRLSYIRVYSGTLKKGSTVLNPRTGKRERISRLLRMHANRREDVAEVGPGEIVAVVGLNNSTTGDTLCDQKSPIVLESMSFPEPVISMAIEPRTRADEEQLYKALQRLVEEDPTFSARTDDETGQQIISGMGELHLDIIKDRLLREFKVDARIGAPQVAYKETITQVGQARGECIRQTGGHGQYAVVDLRVEPMSEQGLDFVDETRGDVVPREFKTAIERGVASAMTSGALAGYPVDNVRVALTGGKSHEVDSSDVAFKIAAADAFRKATADARPALLEPVMDVEILTPEKNMGDVTNDLASRRARVTSMDPAPGGAQVLKALVPLGSMFQYSTGLRDSTQGRGTYTMQPHGYERVPAEIQKEITGR